MLLRPMRMPTIAGALLLSVNASSCWASSAPTTPPEPASLPTVPESFVGTRENVADNATTIESDAATDWWRVFNDKSLDIIVARVNLGSGSVTEAAARLAQAKAELRIAKASSLPQVNVAGSASRQTGPLINAAGGGGSLVTVGANLSYELDLLGRLSKGKKAARLDADASEKLLASVRLIAQADAVQAYFEIRAIVTELRILRDAADAERAMFTILSERQRNGFASELEVVRTRGELASIESEALILDRRRSEVENGLAFLMGEVRSDLTIANAALEAPPIIPADIPSNVLARRPDVAAAERSMNAAALRVGIATTAWLPQLSLTSSQGYASSSLGSLLQSATQNIGLNFLLALPFLDGGRRAAGIKKAKADLELASAQYRTQILTAFRDVENQLSAVRILGEQAATLSIAVDSSVRAKKILETRYETGLISQLALLEAGRTQLEDRRALAQTGFARYVATIGLVRALGGGWGKGEANGTTSTGGN
jgi:outer membrane protein, multidrug efflux system